MTFDAPFLDHHEHDLDAADRITYRIEQSFRYDYDSPVESVRQRLVVVPPARHGDVHRRAHRVEVTGAESLRRVRQDVAGNTIVRVRAPRVESSVEFRVSAVLERVRGDGPPALPSSALTDPRLLRTTRLTAADDRLRDLAADLTRDGARGLELADRICVRVHALIAYEYGVTTVRTTAAEALAAGRGVCQDTAHLMLALCHLAGLPARYVSGHLLGQGGTHAWVEVLVPDRDQAVAVAFDPCHGRRAHAGYVTVATGRDYADVAPTSGSYVGAPGGRLTTSRHVGVIALAA
ncbi:Transglutaminase-like enzyme, putative cysteine protease [Amycolatopsis xylanica]|uniref:Transglutaminase-like enzyme, putative cysteine protease n=1 Tax=Amycolatopsis xylanica TaxID=589385 RepID=A0A1H3R2K4_9PSEU|nr:transglutaminase family protein [Amycolatopsis xylanica]SDZ19169.1 Transglutaminase-like enzyme, putative cysteine protease [Amycolatopsis xylanica]